MKISADSLSGLMKWLTRDHWREAFGEVLDEHFGDVCEAAGIESFDELADAIGEHWFSTLWGCAFEDFLGRETEHGNIVDDYLSRRGLSEKAINKAYMAAIRDSVMSLYEISDIRPGESLLARDLIRGGEPVRVQERSATRTLRQWDRVALRIVEVRGRTMITGGVLPFDETLSEAVIADVQKMIDSAPEALNAVLEKIEEPQLKGVGALIGADFAMRMAAPAFTGAWLENFLAPPATPTPLNTEGDPITFIELRYSLTTGVAQKQVRAALNAAPELEAASPTFWNWLSETPSPRSPVPSDARILATTMEGGATVLGGVELKGRVLAAQVNSEARAERLQALLASLLGALTEPPKISRRSLDEVMAEQRATPRSSGLAPEQEREIVSQLLDRQYRDLLDKPVPMLGDRTPREAARSEAGWPKLVEWLKHLENRTAQLPGGDPMAQYDFGWMWVELGVAHLRK